MTTRSPTMSVSSVNAMVGEFHRAFDVEEATSPEFPELAVAWLREHLIAEEAEEFTDAVAASDLIGYADALADLAYVTYGAARVAGIDLDVIIEEVHRSNMSKILPGGEIIKRSDGKVLKPPGYSPPDISKALGA